jgi:hypothetical protein
MLDNILTKAILTQLVENLVHAENMTYMEGVLHICNERLIDPLDIGKLISPAIKAKIEVEAMAANLLPKSNTLSNFL